MISSYILSFKTAHMTISGGIYIAVVISEVQNY